MRQIFNENFLTTKEDVWKNNENSNLQFNFFEKIFAKFTWIILILFKYILAPFFEFKIGLLYSDKTGRFLANTEFYLRKRSLRKNKKLKIHFLIAGRTVNHQILKMISRKVLLIKSISIHNYLNKVKKITSDSNLWINLNLTGWLRGKDWTEPKSQLSFSLKEENKGKKLLEDLGLSKSDKFVCIFAKDNLYSDDPTNPPPPNSFWGTKDFRNCNIKNFMNAAEFLAQQNIFVIRMGPHKPSEVLTTSNSKIIDYTGKIRSNLKDAEFADAYLSSKCEFFIGCTSATYLFASIFNRPVAHTNMIPYGETGRNLKDIFIYKKCIDKRNNKTLSISEAMNAGIAGDWLTEEKILELEKQKIFFEENSSEEILDLTKEMYQRLNNDWILKDDEKLIQEKFLKITGIYDSDGKKFPGRIGYNFLKKNKNLI